MTASISIQDIGPIEEFCCELQPGVTVIRGPQGAGKTTILRTVELATIGENSGKLSKRDNSKQGVAEIAGKMLKINKTTRVEGELQVEGLGDCDLDTIHSPKFEKPETRDAARIKALARMAGVKVHGASYDSIIPSNCELPDWDDIVKTEDLIEFSGKLKRAIDREALKLEKESEKLAAVAKAKVDQLKGLDLSKVPNLDELQIQWRNAIAREGELIGQRDAAAASARQHERAMKEVEELKAKQTVSLTDAMAQQSTAYTAQKEANNDVNRIRLLLDEAMRNLADANQKVTASDALVKQVTESNAQIEKLNTIITESQVNGPTPEVLAQAMQAKIAASEAYIMGHKIHDALKIETEAREVQKESKALAKKAEVYRKAADVAGGIITHAIKQIPNCPLAVTDIDGSPRLTIESDRSKTEPFDELSDGERWKVIIPMACAPNRVVVLSQAGWGELQPASRLLLEKMSAERGGYILTAQADDGELRAEHYQEGN